MTSFLKQSSSRSLNSKDVRNFYCELEKFKKKFLFHFQIRDFENIFHIQIVKHFRRTEEFHHSTAKKIDSSLHFSHQPNMYSQTETHNKNEKNPQYEKSLKK